MITEVLKQKIVGKKQIAKQVNTSVKMIDKNYDRHSNRLENTQTIEKVQNIMFNNKESKLKVKYILIIS